MKNIKKIALALAVVFSLTTAVSTLQVASPVTEEVQAATENVRGFVGQKWKYEAVVGKFKTVKSSNSKIVKVTKKNSKYFTIAAKKAGKATITVKFKSGKTDKINVIVGNQKNIKLQVSGYSKTSNNVFIKVTNKSGLDIDSIRAECIFRDKDGKVLGTQSFFDYDILNGNSALENVYLYSFLKGADLSKTQFKINSVSPISNKTVKVKNKKHYTYTSKKTSDGASVVIKNKTKKMITCRVDAKFYLNGELVDTTRSYNSVYSKKSSKINLRTSEKFDTVKTSVVAYYIVY